MSLRAEPSVWKLLLLFCTVCSMTCDKLLTSAPERGETLDGTLDVSPSLNASFARGDEQFERVFTIADGLGPIFNQPSCETCHPGDGRGSPSTTLTRFSVDGDPVPRLGGGQLQDKAIPGVSPEVLPPGVQTSVRMPPPVFGMGLLEGIPVETLIALSDPEDSDGDNISGRINWVQAADFVPRGVIGGGNGQSVGRFGRKANVSSLLEQVVSAYREDMGITTDFAPEEVLHPQAGDMTIGDAVPDPEVPASEVNDVIMYVRLLAPPNRGASTEAVRRGDALFAEIGCAACHVPTLSTGSHPIAALDRVDVNLYSDLLLHDMGFELADGRSDGTANGFEWRTPPLWGLRLAADALGGTAFFLHDGRTSDLAEAIRLHGGEAEGVRNRFLGLSEAQRQDLIAFLMSL
jgi:CxxC motif-containing protein (DUF1111 family)